MSESNGYIATGTRGTEFYVRTIVRTRPKTEDADLHKELSKKKNKNRMSCSEFRAYMRGLKGYPKGPCPPVDPEPSSGSSGSSDSDNGKTRTGNKRKTLIKCKPCGLIFDSKSEKFRHKKTHMNQNKILNCKLCEFCTDSKSHFKYHMDMHGGNRRHKCDQCDFAGLTKSTLASHKKTHSNVRQYRCKDCAFEAKHSSALKHHCKKENHQPGPVLNSDGTANPRRKPKKTPKSNPSATPVEVPRLEGAALNPVIVAIYKAQLGFALPEQQAPDQSDLDAIQNDSDLNNNQEEMDEESTDDEAVVAMFTELDVEDEEEYEPSPPREDEMCDESSTNCEPTQR